MVPFCLLFKSSGLQSKPSYLGFIVLETVCLFSPDELKVRILLPLPLGYWDYCPTSYYILFCVFVLF